MTGVAAVAAVLALVTRSSMLRAIGLVVAAVLASPLLGAVAAGAIVGIRQARRIRSMRTDSGEADRDTMLALELVGLGVTAGLPFRNAAALTAAQIGGPIGDEMARALRNVAAGYPPSIGSDELSRMFSIATSSESTGAPLEDSLTAHASERRRESATAAKERLAKLPVKMLFPLAFLILPGFILLTVVPPLISGLSKLGL